MEHFYFSSFVAFLNRRANGLLKPKGMLALAAGAVVHTDTESKTIAVRGGIIAALITVAELVPLLSAQHIERMPLRGCHAAYAYRHQSDPAVNSKLRLFL